MHVEPSLLDAAKVEPCFATAAGAGGMAYFDLTCKKCWPCPWSIRRELSHRWCSGRLIARALVRRPKTRRRGLALDRADRHKTGMIVTLCHSCALGQSGFADPLRAAMDAAGVAVEVRTTECMSGCTRPSTCAFRASGKTAYLFGDLTADDLPDLLTFARHYAASADGNLADARVLGALRTKAIARIPG